METLLKILNGLHPDVDFEAIDDLYDEGVLDSLDMVRLVTEIAMEFDVQIPAEELTTILILFPAIDKKITMLSTIFFIKYKKIPQNRYGLTENPLQRFHVIVFIRCKTNRITVIVYRRTLVNADKIGMFVQVWKKDFRAANRVHFRYQRAVAIGQKLFINCTSADYVDILVFALFHLVFQLVIITHDNAVVAYRPP